MMILRLALALSADLPGVAIEQRLADRFKVGVGDTIALTPSADQPARRFVVEAIYLPRPDPATALRGEYQVRFHLPDLALMLGYPDRVDRIGVAVTPSVSPEWTGTTVERPSAWRTK